MWLFQEARVADNDLDVSGWGHHFIAPTTKWMIDWRISLWTKGTSIQVHASSDQGVVKEATIFLDNDVNQWLEASHTEHYDQ